MKIFAVFLGGIGSFFLGSGSANASMDFRSEADRTNYFTITSVEVKEVTLAPHQTAQIASTFAEQLAKQAKQAAHENRMTSVVRLSADDIIAALNDPQNLEKWVTLGEKLWQVILNNKPVANVSTQRISVLPASQTDWTQMENWKGPMQKSYVIEAKNLFGVTVIAHGYTVASNYGGQLNGTGSYLANTTVIPTRVEVAWGYTLNSKVEVADTVNTGTLANPVPGVNLQLQWSIDTMLKHAEGRDTFFVRGDGESIRIN